jgi:hypothetical protein
MNVLENMFESGSSIDDTVASYVFSLALAVVLRAGLRTNSMSIEGRDFSSTEDTTVELTESIVPAIANLAVTDCSFPRLVVRSPSVRELVVTDCDCSDLRISDSTWSNVRLEGLSCQGISFEGVCHFQDCQFILEEIRPESLAVQPLSRLSFRRCLFSTPIWQAITEASRLRPEAIQLVQCAEQTAAIDLHLSPGRMFVNKLMSLVRKHGHREFGVFAPKLRGRTTATSATFPRIVDTLRSSGAVGEEDQIIYLTAEAEKQMFSGKSRPGMRQYQEVADYWDPIVAKVDSILGYSPN